MLCCRGISDVGLVFVDPFWAFGGFSSLLLGRGLSRFDSHQRSSSSQGLEHRSFRRAIPSLILLVKTGFFSSPRIF